MDCRCHCAIGRHALTVIIHCSNIRTAVYTGYPSEFPD